MKPISIHPPLKGEWRLLRPPGHHPFAVDFMQTDSRRTSYHAASRSRFYLSYVPASNFFCWEKQVYAPIDGRVVHVGNGWEDNTKINIWKTVQLWYNATFKFRPKVENGWVDIRPNAGNYIMIQADEGYIVFLAHLRNQSIVVKEGEFVRQGQVIGLVGNSGNSTMPHLHINLFDQMDDPLGANVIPFDICHCEMLSDTNQWTEIKDAMPEAGTFLRFSESKGSV